MTDKPSYLDFDHGAYPWKPGIDYRLSPELYRVGKGEQGVLICEPYKSELESTGVSVLKQLPAKAANISMPCSWII